MATPETKIPMAQVSGGIDEVTQEPKPLKIDIEGNINSKNWEIGVPAEFTKQTASEQGFNISKGQLNAFNLRPQVFNEHARSGREAQSILTNTNQVGQIFKASQDNINSLNLTLESSEAVIIDSFETYLNDAELQAVWVSTNTLNFIETTIVRSGIKSMGLPLGVDGDAWAKTMINTDYTGYTGSFDYYQDTEYGVIGAIVQVYIEDSLGNSKYANLAINQPNNWTHFDIQEVAMIEDQVPVTDVTDIIKIGFRVNDKKLGAFGYVDNLYTTPKPGKVGLELWDMGAELPIAGTTTIDSGTQYTQIGDIYSFTPVSQYEIQLIGGKRLYHLRNFSCGSALEIPGNELLIPGNYYALVLKYIDTETTIYGPESVFNYNYYTNGYAFTTPNDSTPITAVGEFNDLSFTVFSTQDVYLFESRAIADSEPGSLVEYSSSVVGPNLTTLDVINTHGVYVPKIGVINLNQRPILIPKGGKFNLDYNDDYSDLVSKIIFGMRYYYTPPVING